MEVLLYYEAMKREQHLFFLQGEYHKGFYTVKFY